MKTTQPGKTTSTRSDSSSRSIGSDTSTLSDRSTRSDIALPKETEPKRTGLSRKALLAQLAAFVPLAEAHAEALAARGWSAEKTRRLQQGLAELRAAEVEVNDRRSASKVATRAALRTFETAGEFRRELVAALRMVAVRSPEAVDLSRLRLRNPTPAALSNWLTDITTQVKRVEPALAVAFPSGVLPQLERHRAALEEGQRTQALASRLRSEREAGLLAARRTLVLGLDELYFAARMTFAGNKAVLRQFRKVANRTRPVQLPPAAAANQPGTAESAA
jgi:hypothetical protein